MLDNFIAPYDATVIEKFNHAGAVILGKTNMDEFAMGSSNENSHYGAVKKSVGCGNAFRAVHPAGVPQQLQHVLHRRQQETDTGGSISPTCSALRNYRAKNQRMGRVSRFGMIAFASSLDQGGPMTQNAEDAALMLNVMAGHDPKDSTSINKDVPDYTATLNNSIKGLKIGLPKEYFEDGLEASVKSAIEASIKTYESLGAEMVEISLPHTEYSAPAYYVIAPAECSSNLARYDGVRYGYRCKDPVDLDDLYKRSRNEAFGEEVKRRVMVGNVCIIVRLLRCVLP